MTEKRKKEIKAWFVTVLGAIVLTINFYPFMDAKLNRSIEAPVWVETDTYLAVAGLILFFVYPIRYVFKFLAKKYGVNIDSEK